MVKIYKILAVVIFFTTANPLKVISQNFSNSKDLLKFRNWSINYGLTYYDKAESTILNGIYVPEHINGKSFTYGIESIIARHNDYYMSIGVYFPSEVKWYLYKNIHYDEIQDKGPKPPNNIFKAQTKNTLQYYNISLPITISKNYRITKKQWFSFNLGYRAMFFYHHITPFEATIGDSYMFDGAKKVFSMWIETQEDRILFNSIMYGLGYKYAFKKLLVNIDCIYTYNFNHTFSGTYTYENHKINPGSHGTYKLSGSHLMLKLGISIIKSKEPLLKKIITKLQG